MPASATASARIDQSPPGVALAFLYVVLGHHFCPAVCTSSHTPPKGLKREQKDKKEKDSKAKKDKGRAIAHFLTKSGAQLGDLVVRRQTSLCMFSQGEARRGDSPGYGGGLA
jgi:hypothetical protein